LASCLAVKGKVEAVIPRRVVEAATEYAVGA
jgi:hypothetical protein